MSEIPEDIKTLSTQAVERMQETCVAERLFLGTVNAREVIRDVMSAALLAERERCALIAEGVARGASRNREVYIMTGVAGLGRVVASAIRSPEIALSSAPAGGE